MKGKRRRLALLLLLIFTICFSACQKSGVEFTQKLIEKEGVIIHACGEIADEDGKTYTYTNSMDALENCYDKGNRIVEIDFCRTSDNFLVCAHEVWKQPLYLNGENITEDGKVPSLEFFKQCLVFNKFRTMTLDDLASFMKEHKDLYVVTDIKEDIPEGCKDIAALYPDLIDRFIVQIRDNEEFDAVCEAGFENIIYTAYKIKPEDFTEDILIEICKKPIAGLVVSGKRMDVQRLREIYYQVDMPLFVYTINEDEDFSKYKEMGADAFYTDRVDLKEK